MTSPVFRLGRRAALFGPLLLAGCETIDSITSGDFFDDLFTANKPPLEGTRENILTDSGPGQGAGQEKDSRPVVLPPAETNADWLMPERTARHLPGHLVGGANMTRVWRSDIGDGAGYRAAMTAQPLIAGQRVFAMDSDAQVTAWSLGSGSRIWRTDTRPAHDRSTNIGGGMSTDGTTVWATTGRAELMALDAASGAIKWRVPTATPGRSAPIREGDRLYYTTIDSRLVAASVNDGAEIWSYQAKDSLSRVLSEASPAVADGLVIAGFGSGELSGVHADTGAVAWSDSLAAGSGRVAATDFSTVRGMPVVDGGRVYATSVANITVCIDRNTGRRLWTRAFGGGQTPLLIGDTLFLVTNDQVAMALAADTGATRWQRTLPRYEKPERSRGAIFWVGPLLASGRLVFVSTTKLLQSVNPLDGSLLAQTELAGPATVSPVAAAGLLFTLTADGTLAAWS